MKSTWTSITKAVGAAAAAVTKAVTPAPMHRHTEDCDCAYRAEVNREGARRRAERASIVDELLSGRRRWVPRRPHWFR
jgi:hypothetical protein